MAESKRFAEMTPRELRQWVIDHDDDDYTESFAALRDAILAERDADHKEALMRATREADRADETAAHWKRVAERAEQERDEAKADFLHAHNARDAAEQERDAERTARDFWHSQCRRTDELLAEARTELLKVDAEVRELRSEMELHKDAWVDREAVFEEELRTAESALGEARTKYGREAVDLVSEAFSVSEGERRALRNFRDREYPATPSGVTEEQVRRVDAAITAHMNQHGPIATLALARIAALAAAEQGGR